VSALRRFLPLLLTLAILSSAALAGQTRGSTLDPTSTAFEGYIELLRLQAGIPGLSGVLIQDGTVVWEKGLGFADVDARIPARADTPYLIGDLTEVLSGVLVLRCAEQRRIVLDREITNYGGAVPQDRATVRQVLNHTSALTGGFRFEPERYAQLTDVVEFCSRQPFRKTLALEILDRLAMARSVPGRDFRAPTAVAQDMFDPSYFSHYRAVLATLALPYRVDRRGHATRMELPPDGVNAATGLVSTVRDLAEFDRALDAGLLLQPETLAAAWQPAVGSNGIHLPTGLGWFVQSYRGTPIVWHYGVIADAYSAMMVKIPARRVTLILLANSDGLAIPFQLDAGDVTRSPFASVLLRMLL
jgi:CubicO group peptidase (beta-lactamase class C family)